MTKDKKGESTDALIEEARTFADTYDRIFGYGKVTEESRLLRRLIRQLESRRDRHMWRARAISMQDERDRLSRHIGGLEDCISGVRGRLQSVSYYSQKPHKAAFDVIEVILFLDGDDRDDEG